MEGHVDEEVELGEMPPPSVLTTFNSCIVKCFMDIHNIASMYCIAVNYED